MKSCIITGGSGFIGSHIVKEFSENDLFKKIFILDLVEPTQSSDNVEFVQCDIRRPILFLPREKISHCFHLAALCKEPGYEWDDYFVSNYIGTRNLSSWLLAHGVRKLIFTSTEMVFKAGGKRKSEEDLPNPNTAYGISKYFAELHLKTWKLCHPDNWLKIVRPGVVFGVGERGNVTRLFNALKHNLFAYVGSRSTIKSCVYVKDLTRFLVFLLNDSSERDTYNFAMPVPHTIEEIAAAIMNEFGWTRFTPTVPYYPMYVLSYLFLAFNRFGLSNPVHPRRVQKLYYSTHISSDASLEVGYQFRYTLKDAIADWRKDSGGHDLA